MIKNVIYGVAVLLIAASAYLAFTTKQKVTAAIEAYNEVEAPSAQVDADLTQVRNALKNPMVELGKAKTAKAEFEATLDSESGKTTAYKRSIQQFQAAIDGAEAELVKFEEAQKQLESLGDVNLDNIGAQKESLENDRKSKERDLEKLTARAARLADEASGSVGEVADLNNRLADIRAKIAKSSRQGRVSAVDSTWGFVVVNQGSSNSAVTENSELLVSRGGRVLGRLKITSLERNQSICDIDASTLRPGVRLQAGDKVTIANPELN